MTAKILIVDDEPSNLDTMEAFLVGEGYELHFAANGLVALEKARNVRPDLILLDVMMPELDGFAVTRRIRQDPAVRSMPIILVTALEDSQSRLEGLQAGADDFLTKPCRREEIRARVRTVVQLNRFRTIAEQRERFGRLFDLSPDGIVLVDHDGTIIASNIQASTYRLGGTLFENLQPEAAATLRGMLVGGCMIHQTDAQEVTLETTKGSRVMHVRASAVPEGDDCLVLLVFDDITAEVQAREALEKMNAELEEQVRARTSQLEEANGLLMSYANFVSHDLRSPLAVVKGYLSLVTEGLIPVNAEAAPAIKQAYGGAVINVHSNSNYGRALSQFVGKYLDAVTTRTTVIIIGDGRSNYFPSEAWTLSRVRGRAKHVLWLNPEQPSSWMFGDSAMRDYQPHLSRVEVVNNLATLSRIIDDLVL